MVTTKDLSLCLPWCPTLKTSSNKRVLISSSLTRKTMLYLNLGNLSSIIVSDTLIPYYLETYERKGKLQKKSLNTDKFKERQFVLDKDQLFYYKNEKQSKCFFSILCVIEDKNFNLIMLGNAQIQIVSNTEYKS
jgi:hypothetical protein